MFQGGAQRGNEVRTKHTTPLQKDLSLTDKNLKNLLTNYEICDTITTKDEGKENPQKPEREIKMKKNTLTAIYASLKDMDYDPEILAELEAEINRGAEKKAANAAVYESFHDVLMDALSDIPATCTELFDAIESKLPAGITKSKVQYALTHLWGEEIVVIPGKPNTYRKA